MMSTKVNCTWSSVYEFTLSFALSFINYKVQSVIYVGWVIELIIHSIFHISNMIICFRGKSLTLNFFILNLLLQLPEVTWMCCYICTFMDQTCVSFNFSLNLHLIIIFRCYMTKISCKLCIYFKIFKKIDSLTMLSDDTVLVRKNTVLNIVKSR